MRSSSCRSFATLARTAADLLFVEPARLVAAVAGDERHGVAFIEQGDRAGDRLLVDAELTRQAALSRSESQLP